MIDPITPREERLLEIIDDLMTTMDWTGTGTIKSGEAARKEFLDRIAAAKALPR